MSIPAGGDIGLEAHPETDQFLRLDAGSGRVQMGAAKDKLTFEKEVSDGWCVLVPAGTWHNITNIGATPMQVYAIYAPAHHAPDKVQATAAAAEADKDDEPAAWSVQLRRIPRTTSTGAPIDLQELEYVNLWPSIFLGFLSLTTRKLLIIENNSIRKFVC
jgi:mannose-6-phosphate isomerase-like protein (cupin superfamily)